MTLKDFTALVKLKITLLNILTAITSYLVAGGGVGGLFFLSLAGFLAAGGSGVLNHYLDVEIDSRMERTSKRPLPSGRIKPRTALMIGLLMIISSIIISIQTLNLLATFFIALGIFTYLVVYTIWLKRRTIWNIVIGGFAGSCPPLAGWAAATGMVDIFPIALALLIFLWTPGHFWGLAIRAEEDYRKVGIPMLPSVMGVEKASIATGVSNILMVPVWFLIGFLLENPIPYFIITIPITALLVKQSIELMLRPEKTLAWKLFKTSSPWLMMVMLASVAYLLI